MNEDQRRFSTLGIDQLMPDEANTEEKHVVMVVLEKAFRSMDKAYNVKVTIDLDSPRRTRKSSLIEPNEIGKFTCIGEVGRFYNSANRKFLQTLPLLFLSVLLV